MSETTGSARFRPRYWPMWLAVGLLWLVSRLPHRMAMAVGDLVGTIVYHTAAYRRHIVETNLRLCFPERTEAERRAMTRENLRYTGRALVEVGIAWWASDAHIRRLATVHGLEHLDRARAEGRGVIAVGAHFTCMDLVGRIVAARVAFQAIYRENRNPVIEWLMQRNRGRHFEHAFDRNDIRAMVRALRQGRIVWYPPDQDFGRRHAVFAPFFGVPAATITLPARLARLSGAAVVPIYANAREDGRGYEVRLYPALEGFPSGDDVADATRLNAFIESEVRAHPTQYYWVHRRFKTRPEGETPPYRLKRRRRSPGKRATQ